MTDAASLVFCLGFAALLADAAVSDLRGFRIANRDPILMVILFTVSSPFRLELTEIPLHLLAGAAAFAVGALLFARGVWGGGDAKLVAAVALCTGFAGLPRFLAVMALAGGVLALAVLAIRACAPRVVAANAPRHLRIAAAGHLPYGVAIAAGGLDWALRIGMTAAA